MRFTGSFFIFLYFLILIPFSTSCQSVWDSIRLSGIEAKSITFERRPLFYIEVARHIPFRNIQKHELLKDEMQEAAFEPVIFEQIIEKLQGEFIIGYLESNDDSKYLINGDFRISPTLKVGVRLGKIFRINTGVLAFESNWDGKFPVSVISFNPSMPPRTTNGIVEISSKRIVTETEIDMYSSERNRLQTFFFAGLRYTRIRQFEYEISISDIKIPVEIKPKRSSFSFFGGTGLRYKINGRFYIDSSIQYGQFSSIPPSLAATIALGWRW